MDWVGLIVGKGRVNQIIKEMKEDEEEDNA